MLVDFDWVSKVHWRGILSYVRPELRITGGQNLKIMNDDDMLMLMETLRKL